MPGKLFDKITTRFGLWKLTNITLAVCLACALGVLLLEIIFPVSIEYHDTDASKVSTLKDDKNLSEIYKPKNEQSADFTKYFKSGFFQAASGIKDKPLADKTIERIISQLTLKCITQFGKEPMAYIDIKGAGLKKCCIGDSVSDLFTVLDINKQNKTVDISVINHKVTLYL